MISTDIGEVKKMLTTENGMAGQVIKLSEDNGPPDTEEIADAILNYINNPELLSEHSRNAFIAAKIFDIEECASKYEEVLKDVIGNPHIKV